MKKHTLLVATIVLITSAFIVVNEKRTPVEYTPESLKELLYNNGQAVSSNFHPVKIDKIRSTWLSPVHKMGSICVLHSHHLKVNDSCEYLLFEFTGTDTMTITHINNCEKSISVNPLTVGTYTISIVKKGVHTYIYATGADEKTRGDIFYVKALDKVRYKDLTTGYELTLHQK